MTDALSSDVRRMRTLVDDEDLVLLNRQRLVEVATQLFRTKGFHETSTRDIAIAADMSVGAIYQYIRHKQDLLLLILQAVVEIYEDRIYPLVEGDGTARERLAKVVDAYYRTLEQHHAKTQVLYHEFSALKPSARNHMNHVEETVSSVIEEILRQGISTGEFQPLNTLFVAHTIVSLGQMWALKRWRFRNVMDLDGYIAQAQHLVEQFCEP